MFSHHSEVVLAGVMKVLQSQRFHGLMVICLYFKQMHTGSWCASQVLAVLNLCHLWSGWPWFLAFPNKMYGSFPEISLSEMCDLKQLSTFAEWQSAWEQKRAEGNGTLKCYPWVQEVRIQGWISAFSGLTLQLQAPPNELLLVLEVRVIIGLTSTFVICHS